MGPALLPTALARAAVQVLPVAAAAIVLLDDGLPTLVGVSSTEAVAAERWQFTVGDGPAIDPDALNGPRVITQTTLAAQWPLLHQMLLRHTPFTSLVVLPLGRWSGNVGTLTLYLHQPVPGPNFALHTAEVIAALTYTHLLDAVVDNTSSRHRSTADATFDAVTDASAPGPPQTGPQKPAAPLPWFDGPLARQHQDVWVVVGMIIGSQHCDADQALKVLRAHSLRTGVTVEVLAAAIITGGTAFADAND